MSLKGRQGIDEAWARLSAAEMAANGFAFAIGYVSEDRSKNITRAEIDAYHTAGLAVLLVYEYSVTAAEGGATKGNRDANTAIAQARALGYPMGCALAYAIDEDETAHPWQVRDYAAAFHFRLRAAGFRSMCYGGLATVKYVLDNGYADFGWQTYAWSTVGGTVTWDPRAAIRQVHNGVSIAGKDVDIDVVMKDDIGAWEAEMGTLDDPQGGELYNANAWAHAMATMSTKANVAYNNNSGAVGEVDVPFVTRFKQLEDAVKALQDAVAAVNVGTLGNADRALITSLTDAVNKLDSRLASP